MLILVLGANGSLGAARRRAPALLLAFRTVGDRVVVEAR